MRGPTGEVFGDIKSLGYVVGPGSVVDGRPYEMVSEMEPADAPQWLLDMATRKERIVEHTPERAGIPNGEHDAFLVSLAGWLRSRHRLSEEAIRSVLPGATAALEGVDDSRPFTNRDFDRIARQAAKWEPSPEAMRLLPLGVESAADMELVGPPIEWVVHGFVPSAEVVLMYGKGGVGKSSMGSWLAAEVTKRGKTFALMATEESASRFIGRAVLAGADRSLMYNVRDAGRLVLPRDAEEIRTIVLMLGLNVLYVDAIYTHFEHKEGQNEAIRARGALAPLADIAHETGCSIFGVFHANKAGLYLGSVEMEDVARCLLLAERPVKGAVLSVKVAKTNFPHPQRILRLEGVEQDFTIDGLTQYEIMEDGEERPMKIVVPRRLDDAVDTGEIDIPEEIDPDDIEDESMAAKVRRIIHEMPSATQKEVAENAGCSERYVRKIYAERNR